LPHQVVNSVLQDRAGYIWLGTETALVRFDGVEFKEFSSPLIANEKTSRIRAIVQESSGDLLIAPDVGGLVRLRDRRFIPHPAAAALQPHAIATLFAEPGGAVWVGYLGGEIERWENGTVQTLGAEDGLKGQWASWAYDREGHLWFANSTFLGRFTEGRLVPQRENLGDRLYIASARSGGIWAASNERLCKVENGQVSILIEDPPWSGVRVRHLFEDQRGNLWIATSSRGLFRYASQRLDPVTTSHASVNMTHEDYEGNIWVATHGGGLNRLRRKIFDLYNASRGLADDISYSVASDREGGLWVGNCDGGLARFDGNAFEMLTQKPGWPGLRVFSVDTDMEGNAWIGTRTGLYWWNQNRETVPQRMEENIIRDVHVIFPAKSGDVWIGADPDVLGRFRGREFMQFGPAQGFKGNHVRAIAETSTGEIWVGTEDGELLRFRNGRFDPMGPEHAWPGSSVRSLWADPDGLVWVGTSGSGLFVLDGERFARLTTAHGLPANVIFQIVPDQRGRIWFGSPAGLFHASRAGLLACARGTDDRIPVAMFGRSDGLASVSCLGGYQPTATALTNGQLWFATRQGLLKVDTAAERRSQRPPPVLLNEVVADNRPVDLSRPLRIAANTRKLEFRLAVLSYTAPERVQLRHRLDPFDSGWVEAGGARRIAYPRLPAGNYRLQAAASNSDGVWNEEAIDLAFVVLPAWWQTVWFQLTAVASFVGLIGLTVRYLSHRRLRMRLQRLEAQQALEKERSRIARDLHDDLGVSLTQIALLAEMSNNPALPPDRLEKNLSQVVFGARQLVRELDGILWTVNPKNDSLDKLASYVCQFSQQFCRVTPICCRFDVAENIPVYPLSPDVRHDLFLTVKEAMNNVVRHSGATEVWLRIRMDRDVFEIVIEDNGRGVESSVVQRSERNGLRNMRSRIEGLGGTFAFESHRGAGARVQIRFPLHLDPLASSANGARN